MPNTLSAELPVPLLTTTTTEEEAANLLATGKVRPAGFVAWMKAKNGNGVRSWHPTPSESLGEGVC